MCAPIYSLCVLCAFVVLSYNCCNVGFRSASPNLLFSLLMRNTTKASGKMTLTFNQTAYCSLLTEVAPQVIETEQEYDSILAVVEQLTFKKNRTTEEQALHKLLVTLIETYEEQNYPMAQAAPYEILQHILESSGTSQADLVGIIGSSSVVSEVVNGNCPISKAQTKALGDFFRVSPTLFC